MSQKAKFSTQWSAQFYVAAELTRRGYLVSLTLGNAKFADLLVVSPNGTHFIVDVKGQSTKNFWLIQRREETKDRFYVLVFLPKEGKLPRYFVVSCEELMARREEYRCDGRNPARDFSLCYLHHLGRRYWELLDRYDFLSGPIGRSPICILTTHYQFFREVIFALELGGAFVLLSNARSPAFHCDGPQGQRGLMPFLLSLMPASARDCVANATIQQIVAAIKASGRHEWVDEVERKYGLA